ncbi:hypothetical protein [Amycolatopsis sp. lyj-112]|uniref:hypothetical protein n=1 Tax=Amycolatopsis sp. lyj-112 TaxID=2789288 RepID=UPI00397D1FFA
MPAYTFLVQVFPVRGSDWATLREAHTGAPLAGTFGVVDVPENELADAAEQALRRVASMGLKARVTFWEGRKANDKLYSTDAFCEFRDDGTVLDTAAIRQGLTADPPRPSPTVRPDCPHAPHDGSCGHAGRCAFVHHGKDCNAVRPVCPACFDEQRPGAVADIVALIRREGDLVLRCSSCERLSFSFDAELVCDTCAWLVPYVNEELEDRFAGNGGDFDPPPGSCPGCAQQLPRPAGPFSFHCPKCGSSVNLTLDSVKPGSTISTMCPNRDCGHYITLPPSIWCQECGQHLRSPEVMLKVILGANDPVTASPGNARDDETTKLAKRLAAAAESSVRQYAYLTDEQKQLVLDERFLDSMAFSAEPLEDWIRDVAEIRAAGHKLNGKGGIRAMREVHQRVLELGRDYRNAARHIEMYWDRIGDWLH